MGRAALVLLVLSLAPLAAAQDAPATPEQIARARTLFTRGLEHYQADRLNEALEDFLAAWRIVPRADLAYNVARTYERTADASRAIQFYRHYLQRADPDASDRAEVERRIRALEDIDRRQREQIRTLPPSNDQLAREARTFFERGVTMYRRQRYEAAMAAFTAAYNYTRPNPPAEVLYNLALTAERLERRQEAIDYLREYARTLPAGSDERRAIDERVRALRAER